MRYLLTDLAQDRLNLRPFSLTRPLGGLRNGILTQAGRWCRHLRADAVHMLTEPYLSQAFAGPGALGQGDVLIRSTWVASTAASRAVCALAPGQALWAGSEVLAVCLPGPLAAAEASAFLAAAHPGLQFQEAPQLIAYPWHLFLQAKQTIEADFDLVTAGRTSAPVADAHTIVYNPGRIFIEEGVKIRAAVLNAENGCIYLGRGSQVQEGALLAGTLALLEGATANMGAKLRGDNLVGSSRVDLQACKLEYSIVSPK